MQKNEVGCIYEFVSERRGETKGLYEWCREINKGRVTRRKLTPRELAYIFNRCLKASGVSVKRREFRRYTFY